MTPAKKTLMIGAAAVLAIAIAVPASATGTIVSLPQTVSLNNDSISWRWTSAGSFPGFSINDADLTVGDTTYGDAFDGYGWFSVGSAISDRVEYQSLDDENVAVASQGTTADGDVVLAGMLLDLSNVVGLEISSTWTFFSHQAIARQVATFTNDGPTDVTTTVFYEGDVGADSATVVTAGPHDNIVITDDNGGSDPFVTHVFGGEESSVAPRYTALFTDDGGRDDALVEYDITVPAGESVQLMWFVGLSPGGRDNREMALTFAQSLAAGFVTLDERLLSGLDDPSVIANWTIAGSGDGDGDDLGGDGDGNDLGGGDGDDDDDSGPTVVTRPGYTG